MKLSQTGFSRKPKKLRIIIKLHISYFENKARRLSSKSILWQDIFSSSSAVTFRHLKKSHAIENNTLVTMNYGTVASLINWIRRIATNTVFSEQKRKLKKSKLFVMEGFCLAIQQINESENREFLN